MPMKQCTKSGHYYNASIYSECPYCNSTVLGPTIPVQRETSNEMINPTHSVKDNNIMPANRDEGRTVAVVMKEIGIDPVVGWLVCIEGQEKGRDYRIHSDNNYIGRSEKMDICLRGDDTISRENHAVISFDTVSKIFYVSPGEGRSIVRLNGKALFSTSEIRSYDTIEIGKTKLLFIQLCGDRFKWN